MIELTNITDGPIQVVIRHKHLMNQIQCLNLPGKGFGKNTFLLEDARHTEYIDKAVRDGFITIRRLSDL
jgi:hypothetical protein